MTTTTELSHSSKTEKSKVRKLLRRIKQTIKPTHCCIRFDTMTKQWAVLDLTNPSEPGVIRHFEYGYMTNVSFRTQKVSSAQLCLYGELIGIAEGDLIEGSYGPSGAMENIGWKNLAFSRDGFRNTDGQVITRASALRIMSARQAVYKD